MKLRRTLVIAIALGALALAATGSRANRPFGIWNGRHHKEDRARNDPRHGFRQDPVPRCQRQDRASRLQGRLPRDLATAEGERQSHGHGQREESRPRHDQDRRGNQAGHIQQASALHVCVSRHGHKRPGRERLLGREPDRRQDHQARLDDNNHDYDDNIDGLRLLTLRFHSAGVAAGAVEQRRPGGAGVQLVEGGGRPSCRRIVSTACSTGALAASN